MTTSTLKLCMGLCVYATCLVRGNSCVFFIMFSEGAVTETRLRITSLRVRFRKPQSRAKPNLLQSQLEGLVREWHKGAEALN